MLSKRFPRAKIALLEIQTCLIPKPQKRPDLYCYVKKVGDLREAESKYSIFGSIPYTAPHSSLRPPKARNEMRELMWDKPQISIADISTTPLNKDQAQSSDASNTWSRYAPFETPKLGAHHTLGCRRFFGVVARVVPIVILQVQSPSMLLVVIIASSSFASKGSWKEKHGTISSF